MTASLAAIQKDNLRRAELRRCKNDLYYLLTEYLGYGWGMRGKPKGLTPDLHKPICDWLDKNRSQHMMGIWLPRWHHKTTMVVGQIIQDILRDPCIALLYFTHKDALSGGVVDEVGQHLQHNKKLRTLEPIGVNEEGLPYNVLPHVRKKKFVSADALTVNRHRFSRFPTLQGIGAQSDLTGAHGDKAYVDDVIGRSTIQDNQLQNVASWYEDSVLPIVDEAIIRASGTRWHFQAIYEKWIKDPDWMSIVRASAENEDGTPDYTFAHPIYGPEDFKPKQRRRLQLLHRQMKGNFPPQMMNDPQPVSERLWVPSVCEHPFVNVRERKIHSVAVLSDPSPRIIGSGDIAAEKIRGDGEKDFWAIAVLGIAIYGDLVQRILLQGRQSKDWTDEDGCIEAATFMKKFRTPYVGHEEPVAREAGFYKGKQHAACVKVGTHGFSWLDFKTTRKGKPCRFSNLASLAKSGEFLISQDCDPAFVEVVLNQLRIFPQGRNDDAADAVSYVTDPALEDVIPTVWLEDDVESEMFAVERDHRSRYCAA